MRIAYCIDEIEAPGGTERISVTKANALARIPGNEVYMIVAYCRCYERNPLVNVKLIDLDVRYYDDIGLGKVSELSFVVRKRREHKRKLKAALEGLRPDIVISTGMSEKFFLPWMRLTSNPVKIREIHFMKHYRRYLAEGVYQKFIAFTGEFIDYKLTIGGYDRIVVLTQEDRISYWKNSGRVVVMPNPMTKIPNEASTLDEKVAIAVGRLVKQKNFQSLIRTWSVVAESHPEWKLKIYGEGGYKHRLTEQILALGLAKQVSLEGYSPDVLDAMAHASFFVSTSIIEGFALVLIEAMSVGLPLISYDCPTGPKDIIRDGKNGFLVPLNEELLLAQRINTMIEDSDLRKKMGACGKELSKEYSQERIASRWMALFESLLEGKGK